MDLTCISMARGFVYLCAAVYWFSRRVLSWRLSIMIKASFWNEAVEEALAHNSIPTTRPIATTSTPRSMTRMASITTGSATTCTMLANLDRVLLAWMSTATSERGASRAMSFGQSSASYAQNGIYYA